MPSRQRRRINQVPGVRPTVILDEATIAASRRSKDKGLGLWENLHGTLFNPNAGSENEIQMDKWFMIKLFASFRMAAVMYAVMNDCDETYNYWEPLHLLAYGRGLQTWEYSPVYAIRSWLYVYLHFVPASVLNFVFANAKIVVFYGVRALLSVLHGAGEYQLYQGVCDRMGIAVGQIYFILSLLSVGNFFACCTFLPSTFSMVVNMFAMAFWLQEKWTLAICFTAFSALVGWPFAAVLGAPIVVEMVLLRRQLLWKFVTTAAAAGIAIVAALVFVDSFYFGKTVLAPLNIVLYNVISGHGPELYGVEPVSFYLKNLFLNWNLAWFLALPALPLSFLPFYWSNSKTANGTTKITAPSLSLTYWYRFLPVALMTLAAFLWVVIFFSQPHKEERFLFPIYPHIAVLAAVTLASVNKLLGNAGSTITSFLIIVFALLSISRGLAVHTHYRGIMDTHKQFSDHLTTNAGGELNFKHFNDPIRVCLGKEWHRFPSHFFVPEKSVDQFENQRTVEVRFIRSSFRGLLPKHFETGQIPTITRSIPSGMNDMNQEEMDRYVDVKSCDFLFDFDDDTDGSSEEPNYAKNTDAFSVLYSNPVIMPDRSHAIYRAFYIPFISERHVTYGNYVALQRRF